MGNFVYLNWGYDVHQFIGHCLSLEIPGILSMVSKDLEVQETMNDRLMYPAKVTNKITPN